VKSTSCDGEKKKKERERKREREREREDGVRKKVEVNTVIVYSPQCK